LRHNPDIENPMISEQVKAGFDQILVKALKDSFSSGEHVADVSIAHGVEEFPQTDVIMFTVSSYVFRLMVMIYFSPDNETMAHFARIRGVDAQEMDQQALIDAVSENGNLCCGILSRELGKYFPHIGMSTPNKLDKRSIPYLQSMKHAHYQDFSISIADTEYFHVSLCVFDYDNLDFTVDIEEESTETGELELF
jgi:hypothetical protein